jgi:hypothetical protein
MEDFESYLREVLGSAFSDSLTQELIEFIGFDKGDNKILKKAKDELDGAPLPNKLAEFGECIFQLQNYKGVLKNFVEFLLSCEAYENICAFVNRLFVPHIGSMHYKSVGEYTIEQRYFDRFVEIIQYCDIDRNLLMPFFVKIFESSGKSVLFNYKAPLSEYMKVFAKNGEEDIFKYFDISRSLQGIDYFLSIDKFRTINALIDGFILQQTNMAGEIRSFIIHHKTEALEILERKLHDQDPNRALRALMLLSTFKGSVEVDSLILNIYQNTTNAKIKTFIQKELNFEKSQKFSSKAEFFDEVEKTTDKVQQRLYGLRLTRYFEEENINNDKVMTYIMESFKSLESEAMLKFMSDRFKFVDENIKRALARIVYKVATERDTLESSKWALRLIAVLGSSDMLSEMLNTVVGLYKANQKIAEYFVLCVVLSLRNDAIGFIKNLKARLGGKAQKYLDKMLEIYSVNSGRNIEEIFDELADDFGLNMGQRIFDLGRRKLKIVIVKNKVTALNAQTNKSARISAGLIAEDINLKEYITKLQKEINFQNKRFYHTFLNNRKYSKQQFINLIINHNLLGVLAEGLLWGKYKNGRLYETFKLVEKKLLHISGTYILDSEDYYIALVNPLDIDAELLKDQIGHLSINQLGFPKFRASAPNAVWVDSFAGMFVNAHMFITRLQKLTYKLNGRVEDMYNTMVKANNSTNLLTEVEFDNIKLGGEKNYTTTISKIRFYKLDTLLKDGKNYIINRAEALPIGSIDEHIFSNELALIFMSAHR